MTFNEIKDSLFSNPMISWHMKIMCFKKIQFKIVLTSLIVLLNCIFASAAEDELSLEEELDQAQTGVSSSSAPVSDLPTSEAGSVDPALETPAGSSSVDYEDEELQVQSLEQEYAMKGFAMGFVAFYHNYNIDAKIRLFRDDLADISVKSPDFQSIGASARYSILPFNKIGTDINVSIATSTNHSDINFSSIMTIKTEVNLGYAIRVGDLIPIYLLVGIGYEVVKGTDIEQRVVPGGGAIQIGGGMGLGKKINLEIFYSNANHAVGAVYLENAARIARAAGAPTADYKNLDNHVSSNVILGKLSFNF